MLKRLIVNVLGFGLVLLLISGCASTPKTITVSARPVEKPILELPRADVLNMNDIKWIIITPDNWEQQVADLKKSGRPVALFALTDKGYESLGLNFSNIRSYIQQQQAIIAAYNNYYQKSDLAIDLANKEITKSNNQ